jgi:anti-anti-sigma factor
MHITVDPRDDYAVLHLRGDFDTFYVRDLQKEIDGLIQAGVVYAILNLRLVKFINSTALGAIIKASKALAAHGGKLVMARPSAFCRDIIEKVGLDRVVPVYGSDEEAAAALRSDEGVQVEASSDTSIDDEATVLFTPTDAARIEQFLTESRRLTGRSPVHGQQFGKNWNGVGRMAGLDEQGLRFTWNGGATGLPTFAMGQMLAIGTELKVKFRLPLFQQGFCEATAKVSDVEERADSVKIGAAFTKIDDKTRQAAKQYAADLRFLKDELRKATGKG